MIITDCISQAEILMSYFERREKMHTQAAIWVTLNDRRSVLWDLRMQMSITCSLSWV